VQAVIDLAVIRRETNTSSNNENDKNVAAAIRDHTWEVTTRALWVVFHSWAKPDVFIASENDDERFHVGDEGDDRELEMYGTPISHKHRSTARYRDMQGVSIPIYRWRQMRQGQLGGFY